MPALTELPIGTVHHQHQGPLKGQERKNEPGHPFHGQCRTGHEALDTPVIAQGIGPGEESGRKLGIVHSANLARGRDKMLDKTDPGQIEKASEMVPEHHQQLCIFGTWTGVLFKGMTW